jgi:hypothetical protein
MLVERLAPAELHRHALGALRFGQIARRPITSSQSATGLKIGPSPPRACPCILAPVHIPWRAGIEERTTGSIPIQGRAERREPIPISRRPRSGGLAAAPVPGRRGRRSPLTGRPRAVVVVVVLLPHRTPGATARGLHLDRPIDRSIAVQPSVRSLAGNPAHLEPGCQRALIVYVCESDFEFAFELAQSGAAQCLSELADANHPRSQPSPGWICRARARARRRLRRRRRRQPIVGGARLLPPAQAQAGSLARAVVVSQQQTDWSQPAPTTVSGLS